MLLFLRMLWKYLFLFFCVLKKFFRICCYILFIMNFFGVDFIFIDTVVLFLSTFDDLTEEELKIKGDPNADRDGGVLILGFCIIFFVITFIWNPPY